MKRHEHGQIEPLLRCSDLQYDNINAAGQACQHVRQQLPVSHDQKGKPDSSFRFLSKIKMNSCSATRHQRQKTPWALTDSIYFPLSVTAHHMDS